MNRTSRAFAGRRGPMAAAAAVAVLLTACSAAPAGAPQPGPATDTLSTHVHGMTVDADTRRITLATHGGLFDVSSGTPEQVGPVIDLMGFTTSGDGRYYASGHPDPGIGLPEPAGLLRSDDGGSTWQSVALGGKSDFHALAATRGGIVGFDGALKTTADLETWTTQENGFQPHNLSGTPTSDVVLATTEQGIHRSADGGETWNGPDASAPVLLLTAFAAESIVVGVAPDGAVHVSRDAGLTWEATGTVSVRPSAVAAIGQGDALEIWVATSNGVRYSDDGGRTFVTDPG